MTRSEICTGCGRQISEQGVCACNIAHVPDVESAVEKARIGYIAPGLYEYTTWKIDEYTSIEEVGETLTSMGLDGWQMTGIIPVIGDRDCQLIFMRPY